MYQNEPGGPMKRTGLVNKMKQVATNLKTKIEDKKKKKEFEKKVETFKNSSKNKNNNLKPADKPRLMMKSTSKPNFESFENKPRLKNKITAIKKM